MRQICLVIFSILVLATLPAQADTRQQLKEFQERLGQSASDDTSAETKTQRERLQSIIALLQDTLSHEEKATRLKAQLSAQPAKVAALRNRLQQPLPDVADTDLAQLNLVELEQRLTLAQARLLELQQQQENLQSLIGQNDQRLISLREQVSRAKQTPLTHDQQKTPELYQAEFSRRTAQIQVLELELLSLPGQNEVNQLEREQTDRLVSQQQQWVASLQDRVQSRRRVEAEATLQQLDQNDLSDLHPLLTKQQKRNRQLSSQLRDTLASAEQALQVRRKLEAELELINQSYQAIQQELELSSSPLGSELRRYTRRLSRAMPTKDTRSRLDQLRLTNLEISRTLFEQADARQDPPGLPPLEQQQLTQLQNNETLLLNRLRDAGNQAINELSQLLEVQEQLNTQVQRGQNLIYQHLLWIPSVPAINQHWFNELYSSWPKLLKNLQPDPLQSAFLGPDEWGHKVAAWLVLALLAGLGVRHMRRFAAQWRKQLGNVVHDRFSHSFSMFYLPLLISLPLSSALALLTLDMLNHEAWWEPSLITQLGLILAFALFCYQTLLLWLKAPDGLMCAHFATPDTLCRSLRNRLHYLFWLGIPLVLLIVACDRSLEADLQSGPGRLAFILLTVLITLFWASLRKLAPQINQMTRGHRWWQQSQLWLPGLVGLHILLIIGSLLGYVFTAAMVMLALLVLVGLLVTTLLFFRLGNRWLLIEERRLAFKRARERRNEIIEAREKNEDLPHLEENYLDLQTVSDQARILLKTATVILFFALCWLVLRNTIPTFDLLDKIVLWSSTTSGPDGESLISQSITLKNLVSSAVVVILSILAAYNLPGLLELLVLKHLTLSPGSGYAITTVTKYILIMIGIVAGAAQMGLEWSKLQWLIAALGVGLGFGLQEIVANFISGIIILFEKPIRLGDTITIGEYTGTVTKIQIRATTISDWDRKEVIIPNKTFVTDQLINWSLTDPVTRVVMVIGIAYGSDTALAEKLLLEVASAHPKVLDDPEPTAFFVSFGASTLDFELRVFVSNMADRLPVTHDLNQAIDASFKAHGIEIAFPQLDVHLHRTPKSS